MHDQNTSKIISSICFSQKKTINKNSLMLLTKNIQIIKQEVTQKNQQLFHIYTEVLIIFKLDYHQFFFSYCIGWYYLIKAMGR